MWARHKGILLRSQDWPRNELPIVHLAICQRLICVCKTWLRHGLYLCVSFYIGVH
jgi:hypothetical protein